MMQAQSSRFRMFDHNPQTLVDIRKAMEADFRKATHAGPPLEGILLAHSRTGNAEMTGLGRVTWK